MAEKSVKITRERLLRIIEACRSVEERGLDPFSVDVDEILEVIKRCFPEMKSLDDIVLDAETINRISSVIKLQSDWVKYRSTSLYKDPFFIEDRIRRLKAEDLADIFLKSWHPVVELEQLSPRSLAAALKYWQGLVPLDERWIEAGAAETEAGYVSREVLIQERVLSEEAFEVELRGFWRELKARTPPGGKIRYWDFIGAETYAETVRRAYMTSFLVTYGYAALEEDRLEGEVYVEPFETQHPMIGARQAVSIPIPLSAEEWRREREGKRA